MDTLPDPSELRPTPSLGQRSRRSFRATLRAPWARVFITTLLILAALVYILNRTLPGGLGGLSVRLFPPTALRVVEPTATPIIPTPAPAVGLLPPPPTNCPATAPLDSIIAQPSGFSQPTQLFGRPPVWIPQGYLPQSATYIDLSGTPEPYPQFKIVWAIGPTEHPEVMARVMDIATAELAWWSNGGGTPASPVLNLPADAGDVGWDSAPSAFAITHAGCYRLDVSWNGGSWYLIFAAGGSARS